jgi:cytochrome oxidase Cu insertion factor (SCO1/SenC/PrrC family)
MRMLKKPGYLFAFLMLLFIIPLLTAQYVFNHHTNWIGHTTNRGILVQPVLPISQLPLSDAALNNSYNTKNWQNKWVLIYIKGDNCDQRCVRAVYEMNQVRKALGKYQDNILTAYIAIDPNPQTNPSASIFQQFPHTFFLKTSKEDLTKFLGQADLLNTTLLYGQFFLADPRGFVMMRYDDNVNPEDVYHDLNHLLGIGDM